jgi:GNAT superfamily N-acetyltransferase
MLNQFKFETGTLTPHEYVTLVRSVGWKIGANVNLAEVEKALKATPYIVVVRNLNGEAVAAGRAFSDDLTMTFIPDIFVKPEHQRAGLGREIMEMIKTRYGHTLFYFGGQKEEFFEKLGFTKGMTSFTGRFAKNSFFD